MKTCLIIKGRYDYKEMVIQVKNTSFEENECKLDFQEMC